MDIVQNFKFTEPMQNKLQVHTPIGSESSSSKSSALRCDDILDEDNLLKLIKGLISENLELKSLLRSQEEYQESAEIQKLRHSSTARKYHSGSMTSKPVGTRCPLVNSSQSGKEVDKAVARLVPKRRSWNVKETQHDFQKDTRSDTGAQGEEFKFQTKCEDGKWQQVQRSRSTRKATKYFTGSEETQQRIKVDATVMKMSKSGPPYVEKVKTFKICRYCREKHRAGASNCGALGKTCSYCGNRNHIEKACYQKNHKLRCYRSKGLYSNSRSRPRKNDSEELKNSMPTVCQDVKVEKISLGKSIATDDDASNAPKLLDENSKMATGIGEKEIVENEVTVEDSKEIEKPNDKILWVRNGGPNETDEFIHGKIDFIQEKLEMYKSRDEKVPYSIDLGDGYEWSYGNIIQKKAHARKKPPTEILEFPITEKKGYTNRSSKSGSSRRKQRTDLTSVKKRDVLDYDLS